MEVSSATWSPQNFMSQVLIEKLAARCPASDHDVVKRALGQIWKWLDLDKNKELRTSVYMSLGLTTPSSVVSLAKHVETYFLDTGIPLLDHPDTPDVHRVSMQKRQTKLDQLLANLRVGDWTGAATKRINQTQAEAKAAATIQKVTNGQLCPKCKEYAVMSGEACASSRGGGNKCVFSTMICYTCKQKVSL